MHVSTRRWCFEIAFGNEEQTEVQLHDTAQILLNGAEVMLQDMLHIGELVSLLTRYCGNSMTIVHFMEHVCKLQGSMPHLFEHMRLKHIHNT